MRRIPDKPDTPISTQRKAATDVSVEVCLITRLYGGGARPGQVDEKSWIRPPAFKSALRFWWRAGHAHLFSDLAELHRAESRLFGKPGRFRRDGTVEGGPGLVQIRVECENTANLKDPQLFLEAPSHPLFLTYFAAGLEKPKTTLLAEPDDTRRGLAKLHVGFGTNSNVSKDDTGQILAALRLFLVLGGVGGRTRRGAGALGLFKMGEANNQGVPESRSELVRFLGGCARPPDPKANLRIWSMAHAFDIRLGKTAFQSGEAAQIDLLREFDAARRPLRSAISQGLKKGGRLASPILLRPVKVWDKGKPVYFPLAVLGPVTLPDLPPGRELDLATVVAPFSTYQQI